jgi:hypothetical protein
MSDHQEFMTINDFVDYSMFLYRPDLFYISTIKKIK